jgi:membrane-associated protease RseP (regulator of RpoE activity)
MKDFEHSPDGERILPPHGLSQQPAASRQELDAAPTDSEAGQPSRGDEPGSSLAQGPAPAPNYAARPRRRRLPAVLFVATCISLFWAGATQWAIFPQFLQEPVRQSLYAHWQDGLVYTAALVGILLTHEMGHFLSTVRYRIAASYPYFIPFPLSPIGTMGAVIAMDGGRANRRQIFDIGLAGPLAGLAVAIPIMWIGIMRLDFTQPAYGPYALDVPLLVRAVFRWNPPTGYEPGMVVWFSQFNPFFMAGWVGLLITGLNMLPVSQLDGGHVTYALFGRGAHWVARAFLLLAIGYIVILQQWHWIVMVLLVLFIGPDHPPTSNDRMPLGRTRVVIGCLALAIPILCFSPRLLVIPS